jgi:hypothetical protein
METTITYSSWQDFFQQQLTYWKTEWVTQKLSTERLAEAQERIAHYQFRLRQLGV